ncbi:MAG TPA: Rrf2 family transcriptional regulator [Mycobacteriales bacterium]|nr:Rrf2 family transcriptional regulator [Mycobacteriales bacterium]
MTLTKRGDYVVRSALCLARAHPGGESRKIREVVAEMAVPQTYASQILADLVRVGLAASKAGKDGGYRLVRPPETVSLLEVVEAGEGPLNAGRCTLGDGPCRWDAVCPLHETWRAATTALRDVLAATSLADLVARGRALQAGTATPPTDSHRRTCTTITISDRVHIEDGAMAVTDTLRHEPHLVAIVGAAARDAEALREHLDPAAPSWAPTQVAVSIQTRSDMADRPPTLDLACAITTAAGDPIHLEMALRVQQLDPVRTEVRARARLRPPPGTPEPLTELPSTLGRTLVRSLLRQLAHTVEHPKESVARAG